MIKVVKDFHNTPTILKSRLREEAFNENIRYSYYVDNKNRYKVDSVLEELKVIYSCKCAFCEKKLLDIPKHIEHYRPKNTYYWLSYSWDNLLLSCGSCNSHKGEKFALQGTKVNYNSEKFQDVHNLKSYYDSIEQPLLINPEVDDIQFLINYDDSCSIYSKDVRVDYTIQTCALNRNELINLRKTILNDFTNQINEHYFLFLKYNDISRFMPTINNFISNCSISDDYFTLRTFILNNITIFFQDKNIQKILQGLINKLKT